MTPRQSFWRLLRAFGRVLDTVSSLSSLIVLHADQNKLLVRNYLPVQLDDL